MVRREELRRSGQTIRMMDDGRRVHTLQTGNVESRQKFYSKQSSQQADESWRARRRRSLGRAHVEIPEFC